MLAFSTLQYRRYGLTNDFAGYAQAWTAIGHGHLDPWVSVFGVSFLHNNLDLAMYPLALIAPVYPHAVVLSWAHDLAVVGTEAVTLLWVGDIVRARRSELGPWGPSVFLVAAVLLAVNPWSWETIALPLHFEPFATLFAVLAGRDLWRGRHRRLLLWVPLAMGAEALGSLYVVAVGLGAVLAARGGTGAGRHGPGAARDGATAGLTTRRAGAALVAGGGAGLAVLLHLGVVGRGGATLAGTYGYLGAGPHAGAAGLVSGVLHHPVAAATVLGSHAGYVLGYLLAGGLVGVFSPWGAAAALVVILPNALSAQPAFIAFPGAFQSWPAEPFLLVGSVLVACRVVQRLQLRPGLVRARRMVRASGVAVLSGALTLAVADLATLTTRWVLDRPTADDMAAVARHLPAGAEVVASQDLIGRLAVGREAYPFHAAGQRVPVVRREVVVLLTPGTSPEQAGVARRLERDLSARPLVSGGRVLALLVHAPPGMTGLSV